MKYNNIIYLNDKYIIIFNNELLYKNINNIVLNYIIN